MKTDVMLVKCHEQVHDANNTRGPGTATTSDDDFITGNKTRFTLQLTHPHRLCTHMYHVDQQAKTLHDRQTPISQTLFNDNLSKPAPERLKQSRF